MFRAKIILIVGVLFSSTVVGHTHYLLSEIAFPCDTDSIALGNSNIAAAKDKNAVFGYNPASVGFVKFPQIKFVSTNLFLDIQGYAASYIHPTIILPPSYGRLGFGVEFYNLGKVAARSPTGEEVYSYGSSTILSQVVYSMLLHKKFSIGISWRAVSSNLESNRSFGLLSDVGVVYSEVGVYKDVYKLSLGLSIRGVTIAGLKYLQKSEFITPQVVFGMNNSFFRNRANFYVAAIYMNNKFFPSYGVEIYPLQNISLRTGNVFLPLYGNSFRVGCSVEVLRYTVSLSYVNNKKLLSDTFSISLSLRFGK